jgi:hypothetical protein
MAIASRAEGRPAIEGRAGVATPDQPVPARGLAPPHGSYRVGAGSGVGAPFLPLPHRVVHLVFSRHAGLQRGGPGRSSLAPCTRPVVSLIMGARALRGSPVTLRFACGYGALPEPDGFGDPSPARAEGIRSCSCAPSTGHSRPLPPGSSPRGRSISSVAASLSVATVTGAAALGQDDQDLGIRRVDRLHISDR